MTPNSPPPRPAPLAYLAAGIVTACAVTWALRLDRADFRVPFYYTLRGDAFEHAMWLKTTADRGWYFAGDPRLGAPGGMDLHDYPLPESVHFATVRLISVFARDYGTIVNVFYLLGYPLAAWTALYALRRSGISPATAAAMGVLYAFLPYHFLRGQGHILLSGYWAVPLMVVVVLRLWRGEPLFAPWWRAIETVLICAIMPATGVYYAFFGAFFAGVAAGSAAWSRRSPRPLIGGALVLALIGGSLLAQVAPNVLYFARHGRSPEVARRTAWESEHYGLKIYQLLMPALGHRAGPLQKFGIRGVVKPGEYHKISMNAVNENETSSLGVAGSCGFLALLASLLVSGRADDPLVPLGRLNAAAIVLATVGGLGVVFSRLVSPQIRAYNRISVYIAFFALAAVALGLDAARRRWGHRPGGRVGFGIALGLILLIGIWDQSPAAMVPDHAAEAAAFAADARFVRRIEETLPDRPMVFQFPYVPFPESLPVGRMQDYDHLWGYFHSDRLRWSYGAMKGREGDLRNRETATLPVAKLVESLKSQGFGGITVDRRGYDDDGKAIKAALHRETGTAPLIGPDDRIAFFPLGKSADRP